MALDAEGASVLLLDAERGELYFPYVSGSPEVTARLAGLRFPADRGIAGEVIRTGQPLRVDDATGDRRFYEGVDQRTGMHTQALLAVPLGSRQGPLGVLQVLNPHHGGSFSNDDLAFLEGLAGSVAIAIENARLYARVKDSAEGLRAEVSVLRRDLGRRDGFADMLGTGPAMQEVFRLMESAAASPIAVVIEGEGGPLGIPVAECRQGGRTMMTLGPIAGLPMTLAIATLESLPVYLGALGLARAVVEDRRRTAQQLPPAEVTPVARLLSKAA